MIFNAGDASWLKTLKEVTVACDPLPAAGVVVVYYRTNAQSTYTQLFSFGTDDGISHRTFNVESSGAVLPNHYKEIQFRIESSGGAEITGLSFKEEIISTNVI